MISFIDFKDGLIGFPKFVLGVILGIIHGILTDVDTFILALGVIILALIFSPAIIIGSGLVLFAILRVISNQIGYLSAVFRDNVQNFAVKIINDER